MIDIRSAYIRRLLLVTAAVALGLAALGMQAARLTLIEGDRLLAQAESKLVRETWTPTIRGRIRDRKGRVLAYDRPSFDVAIDYRVITGEWAEREAARWARRSSDDWSELSGPQRRELIESLIPEFQRRALRTRQAIADATGLSVAEVDARCLAVRDEVARLAETVRAIRARNELYEYAGNLGYTRDELATRASRIDRPDLMTDAARLRYILAEEVTVDAEDEIADAVDRPLREEVMPHVIVPAVADDIGFVLRREAARRDPEIARLPMYPGLRVLDSGDRVYPLDSVAVGIDRSVFPPPLRAEGERTVTVNGVARHVLGSVRRGIFAEDVDRRAEAIDADADLRERSVVRVGAPRDRGRYVAGDIVGSAGIERSMEDRMRGLRGLRVDRLGGGEPRVLEPSPGRDVTLTLDIMLQARIQALLQPELGFASVQPWHGQGERADPADPTSPLLMPEGTRMDAAAVVIDIASGDLLAMVSTPTLARDGSDLPRAPEARRRFLALHRPQIDRSVGFPIPPGSIAKALVLCAAHRAGVYQPGERISCTGHLYENDPDALRCWIYKQFGTTHDADLGAAPDSAEALKVSCNIFFYTLGRRLGADGIADAYRSFGVGEDLGLPLRGVVGGWLGPGNNPEMISEGDAIQMGIGQGTVAWTPVHAADSLATIARGGVRLRPRLLADDPPVASDLSLEPTIARSALRGLDLAVNDPRGTAHSIEYDAATGQRFNIFDVEGVKVWGKTGTATAPPLTIDGEIVRRGDHSWFVLLCGRERPEFAVAVVAEYGGSGGRVSGPIANQVIRALVDEGYL
ncbi:MAG: penicillin-binding transpeptidase domain-containing protein [Planctomycetota bacterium]